MKVFSKFIFCLCIAAASVSNALCAREINDYRLFVSSAVNFELIFNEERFHITKFFLSNGTEWYINNSSPLSGYNPFIENAEVFIFPNLKPKAGCFDEFHVRFLDILNKKKVAESWIVVRSKNVLPTITAIKKVLDRLTYKSYQLSLSDNTHWIVPINENTSKWKVNDCILISPEDPTYQAWTLMDLDRKILSVNNGSLVVSYAEGKMIPSDE